MSKKKSIAFVGMSHLGLCYSATAAEKGFKVNDTKDGWEIERL